MGIDINFKIDLELNGKILLKDTFMTISSSKKYGIYGNNGVGKTTLLNYIFNRKNVELNKIKDIYMVDQYFDESLLNKSIFDVVMSSDKKICDLIDEKRAIEGKDDTSDDVFNENDRLNAIEDELNLLDYYRIESKIKKILYGLGFNNNFDSLLNTFSGGWKTRVSLARALYMTPTLLLLDEPTNHLDLEANIWLIDYLKSYKNTIMVISHDCEFLDEVCNSIIHIEDNKLNYYNCNFTKFLSQYQNNLKKNIKLANQIEKKIIELKKNNKSKDALDQYIKNNPIPYVPFDKSIVIVFNLLNTKNDEYRNLIELHNVSYKINNTTILENIDLCISAATRIVLVGKNGCGKSSLVKLICGLNEPTLGKIIRDERIRISYFDQIIIENLDLNITPVEYLSKKYKDVNEGTIRGYLGKIGLENKHHKTEMCNLSGGQKIRVIFVEMQLMNPHVIILDEPTNHLDLQTITALINSINNFNGAVFIITHNIKLIEETNCIVYHLNNKQINRMDFDDYCKYILDSINN